MESNLQEKSQKAEDGVGQSQMKTQASNWTAIDGVKCCSFGLTFKADPSTDCWLLYQEYSREQMSHGHCLEAETFNDIREYVSLYTSKVNSLTELKELIYEKFGLDYTINQIVYFQGKWTAEAYITEKDP